MAIFLTFLVIAIFIKLFMNEVEKKIKNDKKK
jgi:hypothetical protein